MRWLGAAAVAAMGWSFALPVWAAPPPASAFARAPQVQEAVISPDGKRIAILGGAPDQRSLSIATIDQPGLPSLDLGNITTFGVQWVGAYAVARTNYPFTPPGSPGLHYMLQRNVAIDGAAKVSSFLLEHDNASKFLIRQPILGVAKGTPARALVQGLLDDFSTTLWSVDPKTGSGVRVEVGNRGTRSWSVDTAGVPRIRLDEERRVTQVLGRAKGMTAWKLLFEHSDIPGDQYIGYTDPEDAALIWKFGPTEQTIVRARLVDATAETIWRAPIGQPATLIWDDQLHKLTGVVTGQDPHSAAFTWFDPTIGRVQGLLAKALSNPLLEVRNWSEDHTRFVARTISPDTPSAWYLFDDATKQLSPLGEEFPELKGQTFGKTSFHPYKARDGLEIPAYLTLPPGATSAARLPLVVFAYLAGDPRGFLEFDDIAQFIATRGYAVLRTQVRGSYGFGPVYERAGIGEWAGKIHTDPIDGVMQLAAEGIVDPARVCIAGEGFGGYLALAGVSQHPKAYRCAASINGVADPGMIMGHLYTLYGGDSLYGLRIWTGAEDRDDLARMSALKRAAQIEAPVLLVHAKNDSVVKFEQASLMQKAMLQAGRSVDLVALDETDHYHMTSANRSRAFDALGAFLAKNLPVNAP